MFMNRKCCCPTNPCVEPNVECCQMGPIMEKPIEKCVQKDIIHEVEHICPINTRVINNHIYKHVYIPQYTCCEEDVVTNVDDCSCNNMSNY
jgi:hypothetical protein